MLSPFTYYAYDFVTMRRLDSLPYTGVTFNRRLMGQGGSWAANLALADPRVQRTFDWQSATQEGNAVCLFADYFGTIVWGGLITSSVWDDADPKQQMQVGANELNEYFGRRKQADDYSNLWLPAGADPLAIAKRVIDDALAVDNPAGGILVVRNPTTSGVTIAPSFGGSSQQMIAGMVDSLAQMGLGSGFDYTIDAAWAGSTPQFTFNLWFPRAGRTAAQNNLAILKTQMINLRYSKDGTQQARELTELSSAAGVEPIAIDTQVGGALTQRVMSRSNVTDQATLNAIAEGDAAAYAWPVPTLQVMLPLPLTQADAADPSLLSPGMIAPGDGVVLRIDPVAGGGLNTSNRFPQGLNYEARVLNITYYPEGTGSSKRPQWWLDLTPPPLLTFPPTPPPA